MEETALQLKAEVLKAGPAHALKNPGMSAGRGKVHLRNNTGRRGRASNISRHISLMQKSRLVATRKDGVKVMVKVTDPKIFAILDQISLILRNQMSVQTRLMRSLNLHPWKGWKTQNEENRNPGNELSKVQSSRGASQRGSERVGN